MKKLLIVLEMIKVEHTVFALPFAFLGAFLAAGGLPDGRTAFWILTAMVGARSAAMAFNRLVDREIDRKNPRTADRALPRGLVTARFVAAFTVASSLLFVFSAWQLNPPAFLLSPIALAIVFLYSYTKRFTALSHLVLGLALAIAPVGGWVAVRGESALEPFLLAAAVLFWVAGFDIIYACQDTEFDRRAGLHSLPERLGAAAALRISSFFHVITIALLAVVFLISHLSYLSWLGLILVAAVLFYEHLLVRPDDLRRVNAAFFTMNGIVGVILLLFVTADLCLIV